MFINEGNILALQVSFLAALISAVGLLSMVLVGDLGRRFSPYISAFAVGVLTTATLFHLLPEGYELSTKIWQWVTLGFFVFLFSGFLLRILTSGQSLNTDLTFAFSSAIALGTHSLLDGILYALAFQGDAFTGWVAVLGLLVHELPEGIIIYYLLRETKLQALTATLIAFVTACVTTIVGTVLALSFINIAITSLPLMMGITAGAFIYIMIFHLGPHAAMTPKKRGYMVASFGVIVSMSAILLEHI